MAPSGTIVFVLLPPDLIRLAWTAPLRRALESNLERVNGWMEWVDGCMNVSDYRTPARPSLPCATKSKEQLEAPPLRGYTTLRGAERLGNAETYAHCGIAYHTTYSHAPSLRKCASCYWLCTDAPKILRLIAIAFRIP